jgi:hypothetical protein
METEAEYRREVERIRVLAADPGAADNRAMLLTVAKTYDCLADIAASSAMELLAIKTAARLGSLTEAPPPARLLGLQLVDRRHHDVLPDRREIQVFTLCSSARSAAPMPALQP